MFKKFPPDGIPIAFNRFYFISVLDLDIIFCFKNVSIVTDSGLKTLQQKAELLDVSGMKGVEY